MSHPVQTPYVRFTASKDATCIAYLQTAWADGNTYTWSGDFGRPCGLAWYHSHVYLSDNYKPKCTWIDGDGTNGIPIGTLEVNFPAFLATEDKKKRKSDSSCHKPNMRAWQGDADNGGKPVLARDLGDLDGLDLPLNVTSHRSQAHGEDRLIVSAHEDHGATELCESETSWGPDFVSLSEGVYCDMSTHTAVPLCSESVQNNCFHLEQTKLRRRDGSDGGTNFGEVVHWK